MTSQIISSQPTARIQVMDCIGDLIIDAGDASTVAVESTNAMPETQQEGETLVVRPAPGDLHLHVPTAATVVVENIDGTLRVSGVDTVNINHTSGDVRIEAIAGAVMLRDLDGDLYVRDAASLTLEDGPPRRNATERERGVRNAQIHNVRAVDIANIHCDLELHKAQTARIENIGGSCTVDGIAGDLRIGNIGGACTIERVEGSLQLDNVGGSASFSTISSVETLGNIGGSLTMNVATLNAFSPEHSTHIAVGGSARIELPEAANVTVFVTAGGDIRAQNGVAHNPGIDRLVYGDGTAHLHLIVGGSIDLSGSTPQQTGSALSGWMGIGAEIGRAVSDAFGVQRRDEGRPIKRPTPPLPSSRPSTGPTVHLNSTAPVDGTDREAVLRMVAAGQISPEDADAMLDALGEG